ncbi:MAG TPA: zinc ribbon domain-containing protein [Candidatus Limnocylindrales bacterium]|nr:zinc ribbon domain-containing protein [Candidatus Limnocylindrales bacterium]
MICPDCGNPIEKDAKFCPKCYARIEPSNLLQRLTSFFQSLSKPGPFVVGTKSTTRITLVDNDGNRREYKSVDDVPPGMRSQIEELEVDAMKESSGLLSAEALAETKDQLGTIIHKSLTAYKFRDTAGHEHVYHSLDELPPNIQVALRRLQGPSGVVTWRGKKVAVRANLVPRFLFSSASIDVYLDGECVFRTGGKIQSIGSHSAVVRIGGSEHQVEVTWQRSRKFCFPYQLKIDGELVADSQVPVENQHLMIIPAFFMFAVMFALALVLYVLFQFLQRYLHGG